MDPISAIANIIQIAEGTFRVVGYLKSVKDGGRARQSLLEEVTLVWLLLKGLRDQIAPLANGIDERTIDALKPLFEEPGGVLWKIKKEVKFLETKLVRGSNKTRQFLTTINWPFNESQVYRTIDIIRSLRGVISTVLAECSFEVSCDIRKDIAAVKSIAESAHMRNVLGWLSTCNFRQKQAEIVDLTDNASWVLDTPEFRSWREANAQLLWCYGAPGAGKSVLASISFSELRRLCNGRDVAVVIIYCSFDNPESQALDTIVASILKQIIQDQGSLPEDLNSLYHTMLIEEKPRPDLSAVLHLLKAEIEKLTSAFIILDGLDEVGDTTVRRNILETLQSLGPRTEIMITSRPLEDLRQQLYLSNSSCDGCGKRQCADGSSSTHGLSYKCCRDCSYAGKGEGNDGLSFQPRTRCLTLEFKAKEQDIGKYVSRRIALSEELTRCMRQKPGLKDKVIESVVRSSENVFLLARLHLDSLAAECLTPTEVENAIKRLTPNINETYDKAFHRMEKQLEAKPGLWRKLQELLLWVSWVEEPLTVNQFGHALAATPGIETIPNDSILPIKEMTSWSAGLLRVGNDNFVRVIHPSVDRYLKRIRMTRFPRGHETIAKTCLNYLQMRCLCRTYSGPSKSTVLNLRCAEYPFLDYAAAYWGSHVHQSVSEEVDNAASAFLHLSNAKDFAVQILWHRNRLQRGNFDSEYHVSPLHVAALFGLNAPLSSLILEGIDVNTRDGMGVTPIVYAAARGHVDTADLLLTKSARVNDACLKGSTALSRAVGAGMLGVTVRLLEEADIDVNTIDRTRRYVSNGWTFFNSGLTPLMIAASGKHYEIVERLLSHEKIDVNKHTPLPYLDTALTYATRSGDSRVVAALLQRPDIDLYASDRSGKTALHWAASSGQLEIANALLQRGASPDHGDRQHGTSLMRACDSRQTLMVRLLVEKGANRTLQDVFGRTALHSATVNGALEALQYLLDIGSNMDINLQANDGITPLHDAVGSAQVEIVHELVKRGARCDIRDHSGRTALDAALDARKAYHNPLHKKLRAAYGVKTAQEAILEILKSAPGYFDTEQTVAARKPLWRAVMVDSLSEIQRRIPEASIDEVNDPGLRFKGSALHVTSSHCKIEALRLLLQAGADPNIKDGFGRTPMYLARDLESISALIDHGADINCHWTYSPIWEYLAGDRGRPDFAAFLIEKGADFSHTAYRITDVLHSAIMENYHIAVRRLVEHGVSVDVEYDGYTALDRAKQFKRDDITEIMRLATALLQRSLQQAPQSR